MNVPKYFISATVYATYEYSNQTEIEADTEEEAGKKFEEFVAQKGNGIIDLREPIDKAMDIEGFYRVFAIPDGGSVDDILDDVWNVDGQKFSARQ